METFEGLYRSNGQRSVSCNLLSLTQDAPTPDTRSSMSSGRVEGVIHSFVADMAKGCAGRESVKNSQKPKSTYVTSSSVDPHHPLANLNFR